jgi:hypothetical protein
MAFANTKDPWIDYQIISRLGGCYATPIIQIFQDGRFRIKIDPQLESATQPKARGLLHMDYDFAITLPYNFDFMTTAVASKVRFTRQSKVDFFSRNSKSAPRGTKSTSVFKSRLKVRSARHKVDFGF